MPSSKFRDDISVIGITDTPFFDAIPLDAPLVSDDIARAVHFVLSQPPHVDVNEILVRPTAQPM